MSALMNECAHGSDGSYHTSDDSPHDYVCPYCEIDRLRAALKQYAGLPGLVGQTAREALEGGK